VGGFRGAGSLAPLGLLPGLRNAAATEGGGLINPASGSPALRWDPSVVVVGPVPVVGCAIRARAHERRSGSRSGGNRMCL